MDKNIFLGLIIILVLISPAKAEINMPRHLIDYLVNIKSDNNFKNGLNKEVYESGERLEFFTIEGKAEGATRFYNKQGKISAIATMVNGKQHGIVRLFDNNNKLKSILIYREGILVAEKIYSSDGSIETEQAEDVHIVYNHKGEIKFVLPKGSSWGNVSFEVVEAVGKVSKKAKDVDSVVRIDQVEISSGDEAGDKMFVAGEGEIQEYYDNGFLKEIENYENYAKNIKNGICRKYYSGGMLEEVAEYTHGKLTWSKKYDKDGNLVPKSK